MPKQMPMPRDEFKSMIGEGMHTAFRKGVEGEEATAMHRAISRLPDGMWSDACEYVTWGFEVAYDIEWAKEENSNV